MSTRIIDEPVDAEAFTWFCKYLTAGDHVNQIFRDAQRQLNLPPVTVSELTDHQRSDLTALVKELINADEERDTLIAYMKAGATVDALTSAADRLEAEHAAGVVNLADRR